MLDEQHIRIKTEQLRKKYSLEYDFDLKIITTKEKMKASLQELEPEVDGFTDFSFEIPLIIINRRNSPRRQRYTLAHELGHFCLHFDKTTRKLDDAFPNNSTYFRRRFQSKDTFEREADLFANHLLMPEKHIADHVNKLGSLTDLEIKILSEEFNVTEIDMFKWLTHLNYL
jgi:Zn-dependent peptidase ImmA (M78 family)